jgi:hypothetical protein
VRVSLFALALLAGCPSSEPKPDLSVPDLASIDVCSDDSPDAAAATFANVQRIFDTRCVQCHCCGAYLDFTIGDPRAMLIQRVPSADDQGTDERCGGVLVVPGDAGVSYLYQKLSSPVPCAGLQMPRIEIGSLPLPTCEQDLIRRWIDEGAN